MRWLGLITSSRSGALHAAEARPLPLHGGAALAALMIGLARSFAVYLMPEMEVLMPYLIATAETVGQIQPNQRW